ncbi:MAG: DUF5995 family protein [Janthinobacterium lividum]
MSAVVDAGIAEVVDLLQDRLDALPDGPDPRRAFLGTYLRTTTAIGQAIAAGLFEDPEWVRRWDVAFVGYFLAAHDADVADGRPDEAVAAGLRRGPCAPDTGAPAARDQRPHQL